MYPLKLLLINGKITNSSNYPLEIWALDKDNQRARYYAKPFRNIGINHYPTAKEIIACEMAILLDLPTPSYNIINIDDSKLGAYYTESEVRKFQNGYKFCSKKIEQYVGFGNVSTGFLREYEIAGIFAFDVIMQNSDRGSRGKPNLLINDDSIVMIDHELTLWFIDENGSFRIEHEKYLREYDPQIDLTSATYDADKPEIDNKVYNYEQADLYNQINFSENNSSYTDWITFAKIEYSIPATSLNVKDIDLQSITTDVLNISENPNDANSNGLLLLRLDANDCVQLDLSMITAGTYFPNQKLSWAWLTDNYMNYFAEAESGTNEEGSHTFTHVKEFLKQKKIKFRYSGTLLWYKPLTLSKGVGWIEDAEYDPESGMYSVNVEFDHSNL